MLNIASVNMPKIKPETKVLIIKTLKSKSPAEVADIFNLSKRQVERIRKRYQETGDVHDRPRSGRRRKTTVRDDSLLVRLSKARPMSTVSQLQEEWTPATPVSWRTVRRILARNVLYRRIASQKPALNKRQLRNRVAYAKVHRKVANKYFFRWIVSWAPSHMLPILSTTLTQKTVKFGGRKIIVWGYIQYGGVREICKVVDSAKYQQILASQYIPNYKRGQIFNRMELLAIPQVPLWSFSGGRRSRSFRDDQHSL